MSDFSTLFRSLFSSAKERRSRETPPLLIQVDSTKKLQFQNGGIGLISNLSGMSIPAIALRPGYER